MNNQYLKPDWPAPSCISAFTTLRFGGVSQPPYDTFNLADHVNDSSEHVKKNREILKKDLGLINEPIWIEQTHSSIAIEATSAHRDCEADASFTKQPHQVCVILTADCLPLLVCNKKGTEVAAIHAGWKGLANGVIVSTLEKLHSSPEELLVWLGPAISAAHYEVGDEVRQAFIETIPNAESAFMPSPRQRWLADLYTLAKLQMNQLGVTAIYGGNHCTYADPERFYSYRRDGVETGRMASLIWIS